MTRRTVRRILNGGGALVSFLLPAAAAISEFPRIQAGTAAEGGGKFLAALNLSAAAFAVIAVLALVTAMRFLKHRIAMPKSGLILSVLLYLLVRGIRLIVKPMEVILFWSVIGCGVAFVMYFIADHLLRDKEDGV